MTSKKAHGATEKDLKLFRPDMHSNVEVVTRRPEGWLLSELFHLVIPMVSGCPRVEANAVHHLVDESEPMCHKICALEFDLSRNSIDSERTRHDNGVEVKYADRAAIYTRLKCRTGLSRRLEWAAKTLSKARDSNPILACVSTPIPFLTGKYTVSSVGGVWLQFPYRVGCRFDGDINVLAGIGKLIGAVHGALFEIETPDESLFVRNKMDDFEPREWELLSRRLRALFSGPLVKDRVLPEFKYLTEVLWSMRAGFRGYEGPEFLLREQFIHGNLHSGHLTLNKIGGSVAEVSGFHSMVVGHVGVDIASLCHHMIRQFIISRPGSKQGERSGSIVYVCERFLSAYMAGHDFGEDVDSSDVAAVIPIFMREYLLRRVLTVLHELEEIGGLLKDPGRGDLALRNSGVAIIKEFRRLVDLLREVDEIEAAIRAE